MIKKLKRVENQRTFCVPEFYELFKLKILERFAFEHASNLHLAFEKM